MLVIKMGCGLETVMAVRAEAIEQGRLSRELWVTAPADSDSWRDNARAAAGLLARLQGLACNQSGVLREEIFVDNNGEYRKIMNVDCPSFDRPFIEKLKDMGARGRFYLFRLEIDFAPETNNKLASLRSMNPYFKFKTYEQEKQASHTYEPADDWSGFLH